MSVDADSGSRRRIAEAWAPIFFHDESPEFNQRDTGFNPVDTPVGLFFDGNDDLRDNGINIFSLSPEREIASLEATPIYYSVIESRSHFYLNYVVYHAIDGKEVGHVHDTENVFIVIEKDASRFGKFVMLISNAHGYPMIYGPEQNEWRSRIRRDPALQLLPALDAHSDEHHRNGELEWVDREGGRRSPVIFIGREGHALYKFSSEAWVTQGMRGSSYALRDCGDCDRWLSRGLSARLRSSRNYDLVDLDELLLSKLSGKVDSASFFAKRGVMRGVRSLYRDRDLPSYLVQGFFESEARVNLFYAARFKTPFPLSDPASFHRYFGMGGASISPIYIFNPYVEKVEASLLASTSNRPKSSGFSIRKASLLFFADRLFE